MNTLALGVLLAYAAWALVEHGLDALNRRHLLKSGTEIPAILSGQADQDLPGRMRAYTLAKHRLATVAALSGQAATLVFFYAGLLRGMDAWAASWRFPFVVETLIFFLLLYLAQTLLQLPLSWYRQFRLETRFGFNTLSPGLWARDRVKSFLLGGLVLTVAVTAGTWLVVRFPSAWWLWVWVLGALLSWALMTAGPLWLDPWFNRFTPLAAGSLTAGIQRVLDKAGIRVGRVFSMDASRRSRHTNAYFTGVGKVKRIVLFDTLLAKLSEPEILAVLAHEAAHWRKRHLLKRTGVSLLLGLAACYLAFALTRGDLLAAAFGMPAATFAAKLTLAGLLFQVLAFPLNPFLLAWSRRQELAADGYAATLTGDPASLAGALVKLSRDNLANWAPHPLYAAFHYSHPPLLERLEKLASSEKDDGRVA